MLSVGWTQVTSNTKYYYWSDREMAKRLHMADVPLDQDIPVPP